MNYFDRYKLRVGQDGDNPQDSIANRSLEIVSNAFNNSPSLFKVLVDNIENNVVMNKGKTINDKRMLFRHDSNVKLGSIIDFNEKKYIAVNLVMDTNELYPSASLKLCNTSFELEGETTQILIGTDPRTNRPVYKTVESSPITLNCIAEKTIFRSTTDEAINLPEGQILITIPYIEHKSIAESQKIDLYNDTYQIIDVDDTESINKVGIRKLTARRVVSTE
ncbi:hypothetical protein WKH56_20830 [Priestia sp. SB1]|uniref:hypothetical protein n=1 Tax=Priestia sp. SB1 TaxID=3132359 RepID=UPI00317AA7C4